MNDNMHICFLFLFLSLWKAKLSCSGKSMRDVFEFFANNFITICVAIKGRIFVNLSIEFCLKLLYLFAQLQIKLSPMMIPKEKRS